MFLSRLVFWAACGIRLYRFLIIVCLECEATLRNKYGESFKRLTIEEHNKVEKIIYMYMHITMTNFMERLPSCGRDLVELPDAQCRMDPIMTYPDSEADDKPSRKTVY